MTEESVLKLATYLTFIVGGLDYQHGQKELTLAQGCCRATAVRYKLEADKNRFASANY